MAMSSNFAKEARMINFQLTKKNVYARQDVCEKFQLKENDLWRRIDELLF